MQMKLLELSIKTTRLLSSILTTARSANTKIGFQNIKKEKIRWLENRFSKYQKGKILKKTLWASQNGKIVNCQGQDTRDLFDV